MGVVAPCHRRAALLAWSCASPGGIPPGSSRRPPCTPALWPVPWSDRPADRPGAPCPASARTRHRRSAPSVEARVELSDEAALPAAPNYPPAVTQHTFPLQLYRHGTGCKSNVSSTARRHHRRRRLPSLRYDGRQRCGEPLRPPLPAPPAVGEQAGGFALVRARGAPPGAFLIEHANSGGSCTAALLALADHLR